MTRPIIALTTDFGDRDSYVAQMKGVILGINPDVQLVDVTHAIGKQDVLRAALVLAQSVAAFPPGTIHLVVVDPGVGTDRRMVGVEMGGWRFVAPDNGVLSMVARQYEPSRSVELNNAAFFRQPISNTFHGRDMMGPVAAHWSLGTDLAEFGDTLESSLVQIPVPKASPISNGIQGEVILEDSFGNLITNIDVAQLSVNDRERVTVEVGPHVIQGIRHSYGDVAVGTLLALVSSSNRLEIAVNSGSAASVLKATVGSPVRVIGFESTKNG